MMQNPVQNGGGNGDISKCLIPLGKGLIGGKDCGCLLILPCDELEKQVNPLNVHRQIPNLIDDKHPVLGQDFKLVWQPVLKVGFFSLLNELMTVDVVGGESVFCSHKPKG